MSIRLSELLLGKSKYEFGENSRVIIKFTKSVSVPNYMGFRVTWNAFDGWISSIVSSDYDVYHMRRRKKQKNPKQDTAIGIVNLDELGR